MEKMPEAKWKITIHPKPQGFWRPKISVSIYTDTEDNPLNISTSFMPPIIQDLFEKSDAFRRCAGCSECNSVVPSNITLKMFKYESSHNNEPYICPLRNLVYLPGNYAIEFYADWRPGVPDYTDYYEWLRDSWCLPIVTEYNRRIQVAMESVATPDVIYTSEDYEHNINLKEKAKRPTRKLSVVDKEEQCATSLIQP